MSLSDLAPPNVAEWPLWARRAFVLTFPVSGPIWAAWFLLLMAGVVLFSAGVMALVALAWIVTPLAAPLIWAWEAACTLWSGDQ